MTGEHNVSQNFSSVGGQLLMVVFNEKNTNAESHEIMAMTMMI